MIYDKNYKHISNCLNTEKLRKFIHLYTKSGLINSIISAAAC